MITIENKFATATIYTDTMDSGAEGLIRALCGNPLSEGSTICVMPDVHAGKGCAIGTTMTIGDKVAPGLVGVDIGCGMTVTKVSGKRLEMQRLDKLIRDKVPAGRAIRSVPHRFSEAARLSELYCLRHIQVDKARASIGTLGGGNHFIELDRSEDGSYWLVIHSGSRHLGMEIATYYHDAAFKQAPEGIPYELAYLTGESMENYLHDEEIAREYAAINRQAITDEIIKGMKLTVLETFTTEHNYIDAKTRILRKGAVSAAKGERLIIPMNMRDGCLICVGKGNARWNESAPHGAGRLMNRAEVKQSFTLSQFKKEMKGIYSTSISHDTLDESPMAYKPMDMILSQIEPTVSVIERITPIYNFKAGSEV